MPTTCLCLHLRYTTPLYSLNSTLLLDSALSDTPSSSLPRFPSVGAVQSTALIGGGVTISLSTVLAIESREPARFRGRMTKEEA